MVVLAANGFPSIPPSSGDCDAALDQVRLEIDLEMAAPETLNPYVQSSRCGDSLKCEWKFGGGMESLSAAGPHRRIATGWVRQPRRLSLRGMRQSIRPMIRGRKRRPPPRLIVRMSCRLVIPWRVALQQSPPPLHQPEASWHETVALGEGPGARPPGRGSRPKAARKEKSQM